LVWPAVVRADQARYFYDELGRLVGVADGTGEMAVYTYDPVGNLLSIQRFATAPTGIGIFLLAPSSGAPGAQVEIRGFGFAATAAANQVAFNGQPATVLSATTTSIVATVPATATTGPVTVTNANGTATSPQAFTVLVPQVTGIDPVRVAQGTTTFAVISGASLSRATAVQFAQTGLSARLLSGATADRLPVHLTVAATVPVGSYPFSVVTSLGVADSGAVAVTVAPAVQAVNVAKLSVFLPFPAQVRPSGGGAGTATLSAFLPFPAQVGPSGSSVGAATSSVFLPHPAQAAASGSSVSTATSSVFVPHPAQASPSGSSASTTTSSVFVPHPAQASPSGGSASAAKSSVFLPNPAQVAPSGSSMSVAPPASVSAP
jgi:YD repeat-containing protein